ncbi:alpha/beta hydrolase [Streptomyces sp. NPDC004542]|uniref:alpha/beta hydrolase n=1 Tax=Streptomyces sp. NPDC004542 TaxID=3154281 RepID=UPI0033B039A1
MTGEPMHTALRAAVRELGTELTPSVYRETVKLLAPLLPADLADGVDVRRDLAYGPHERHRLDVFGADPGARRTVLVYVHGGGFVGGAKKLPRTPFYDNIGLWAARGGYLGVTMNYRLAPEAPWPAGSADLARAVEWIGARAAEFGGDPGRIVLMGQSAGATHVAGYLAGHHLSTADDTAVAGHTDGVPEQGAGHGVIGAVLSSCLYDAATAADNLFQRAYFGADRATWSRCSALRGLVASDVPLLMTVSEFDELDFQRQAALLVAAWSEHHGTYPPLERLWGHNHLTSVLQLGSPDDTLGPLLRRFIETLP